MILNLLVAPDFSPERFAGWHLLNTLLQKDTGLSMRLWTPASAAEQAQWVSEGKADVVYANPFDAAGLIRRAGYVALARPIGKSNEIVIAAGAGSDAEGLEDLRSGLRVALTDNKDVRLIGLRLLEVADLAETDVRWQVVESHQAAARMVLKGEADVCFLLAGLFHSLSRLTRDQLKPLIESKLGDITHVLLVHPKLRDEGGGLQRALLDLAESAEGRSVLDELGFPHGFEAMSAEDGEFMIDVMDTLLD